MMFLFKYRFHCTDTSHTSLQFDESQRDGNPFNNRHSSSVCHAFPCFCALAKATPQHGGESSKLKVVAQSTVCRAPRSKSHCGTLPGLPGGRYESTNVNTESISNRKDDCFYITPHAPSPLTTQNAVCRSSGGVWFRYQIFILHASSTSRWHAKCNSNRAND